MLYGEREGGNNILHSQYSTEILLNQQSSENDADNGVSEVWLTVGTNEKDDNETSHCEQHSNTLCTVRGLEVQ